MKINGPVVMFIMLMLIMTLSGGRKEKEGEPVIPVGWCTPAEPGSTIEWVRKYNGLERDTQGILRRQGTGEIIKCFQSEV